ncbi:MAG: AAA family ATPase [Thermomicrobiales bacterium]
MSTAAPPIAPFETITLAELIALELPEVEYAVDGILPLGSLTLLAAREKAGKSLLLVDLCCSIALGEPFLDRAVKQGPAILVPAEENMREIRDRVLLRLDGRTDADLHILPVNGFTEDELRIDQGDSLARLLATIQHVRPVIAGLDPMRELHNLRENDSDDMGPMLRPVRQIAHTTNTALVMNHHMSLAGRSRGSTAIRASADQEWAFKRRDDETTWEQVPTEGVLRVEGRFGPRLTIGVRLGPKIRWGLAQVILVGDNSNLRGRIIILLQQTPDGLSADAITEKLGAMKKTVQNTISAMLKEQPAKIVSVGRGVKGDPRRFQAVDPFLFEENADESNEDETIPTTPGNNRNNKEDYSRFPNTLGGNHFGNHFREQSQNGHCTMKDCVNDRAPGNPWFCEAHLLAGKAAVNR